MNINDLNVLYFGLSKLGSKVTIKQEPQIMNSNDSQIYLSEYNGLQAKLYHIIGTVDPKIKTEIPA